MKASSSNFIPGRSFRVRSNSDIGPARTTYAVAEPVPVQEKQGQSQKQMEFLTGIDDDSYSIGDLEVNPKAAVNQSETGHSTDSDEAGPAPVKESLNTKLDTPPPADITAAAAPQQAVPAQVPLMAGLQLVYRPHPYAAAARCFGDTDRYVVNTVVSIHGFLLHHILMV